MSLPAPPVSFERPLPSTKAFLWKNLGQILLICIVRNVAINLGQGRRIEANLFGSAADPGLAEIVAEQVRTERHKRPDEPAKPGRSP